MRRAERLFQVIQILRRSTRPVTAAAIAGELEVSVRTVYRDVADLVGQRVPIAGEAGFGYVLDDGFDMPPLMLTRDEIEAAVLGAQWVMARGDRSLAGAARDLVAKIAAVVPEAMRGFVIEPSVGMRPPLASEDGEIDGALLRRAIQAGHKLRLVYRSGAGEETQRVVWPVMLGHAETVRMLIGWCELRGNFRHFRVDRIVAAEVLAEPVGEAPRALRRRWEAWRAARIAAGVDQEPGASS